MTSIRGTDRRLLPAASTYRLVGGKGGVGKTTCAAAIALSAARQGLRTLIITTDPAPSLADALGQRLGDTPRRVRIGRHVLHAVELDAPRAFEKWLSGRRPALERIATRGTWLDEEDVARLLRLSLPGIDEVAALFEILAFGRSGEFEVIVVDTAPTGHTLRLLAMPRMLRRVAGVFDAMQSKHRAVVAALRGAWRPDAEDALIADLAGAADDLHALLRDLQRVTTLWVTLPEPMAVSETADAVATLRRDGLTIDALVVNRLTPPPPSRCARCTARRAFEAKAVRSLRRALPGLPLRAVAAQDREPQGARALLEVARDLDRAPAEAAARGRGASAWRAWTGGAGGRGIPVPVHASTKLLMFGGKGGVGKTTCAAAAALGIASVDRRRRVLLVSTDPAHSLADAIGDELGDAARPVRGAPSNLSLRELDAPARFDAVRQRYAIAIEALFGRLSRGSAVDASHDRRVIADLIDLAPPGVDELVAVAEVADLVEAGGNARVDLVVMDLAPSGHALRLLETPSLVQDWTRALMGMLLKYRAVVGVGELGALLLQLSKSLGRLRELLRDPARCQFMAVTRGAMLPRAETERLLKQLRRMRVPVAAVIVNATGRGTCRRCRLQSAAEGRHISAIERSARRIGARLIVTPEHVPPPRAPLGLRRWAAAWRVPGPPSPAASARPRPPRPRRGRRPAISS